MVGFKRCFFVPLIMLVMAFVSSCKNNSGDIQSPPESVEFKQPVVRPLEFSKAKKIDWGGIKSVKIQPVIKKLDMAKLPAQNYNGPDFNQVKYVIEDAKFDLNTLPVKDFDVDRLPSKPFRFKTFLLPPPKLIRSGAPHLKTGNSVSLFELSEAQGLRGNVLTNLFTD